MHSKRSTPTRPIIAAGCIAVAIDVLLNCILPEGFMTRTVQLRAKEIVARAAPQIQIMGDSVSAGIPAPVVAAKMDMPADAVSNYSLPGTSPVFPYFTLRRQIESGRIPKLILFGPHPAHFGTPMHERFIGRFATWRELSDYTTAGPGFRDLLFGVICRASYTMRYREELYGVVTQGNLEFFRTLRSPAVSVTPARVGPPQQPPAWPPSKRVFREEELPPALLTGFTVDPVCGRYTDRFLELAAAHQVQVLWISMPTIAALNERWERSGDAARFATYLTDLAKRHPNFAILHGSMDTWPDAAFADPRHLTAAGAWSLAEQTGAELAAYLQSHPFSP